MTMQTDKSVKATSLRRKAERDLSNRPDRIPSITKKDLGELIHELQEQQIELEMQNEELQRAQEEIGESKRRYLDLYDFAPSGYFTFDRKGRILEVNLTGSRLLGIPRSRLIGRRFTFFLDASSITPFRQHLLEVFSDETRRRCELRILPKQEKTPIDVLLESEAIGGIERECRSVVIDITGQKKAEMEVVRQRQELAHVSRMATVKGLTSALVHEISQTLQTIQSNAQMTETILSAERPDINRARKNVEWVLKGITEASQTVHEFRELFRRGRMALKPVNINQIVREVREFLRRNIIMTETPYVTVTTAVATDLPRISGNEIHLKVALLNLCLNALDSMSHGNHGPQKLILRTEKENQRTIKVSVKDTGTGINEDNLPRLFKPGYTTKPDGMGIGLSISQFVIEAHGGTLSAVNNSGKGATFYFRLPIGQR